MSSHAASTPRSAARRGLHWIILLVLTLALAACDRRDDDDPGAGSLSDLPSSGLVDPSTPSEPGGSGATGSDPLPAEEPTLGFSALEDGALLTAQDDEDPASEGLQLTVTLATDAEDGQEVVLEVDGQEVGRGAVSAGEATPVATLPDGDLVLEASVTNAAGLTTRVSVSLTVDTVLPALSFVGLTDGDTLTPGDDEDPEAAGLQLTVILATDAEDGQEVLLDVDGEAFGPFAVADGEASGLLTLPEEGAVTLTATVENAVGNVGVATVSVTVQPPPSTVPVELTAVIEATPTDPYPGEFVDLDGSGSTATGEVSMSWRWELIDRPEDSDAEIAVTDGSRTGFIPDVSGRYEVELTVSHGEASDTTTAVVQVQVCDAPQTISENITTDTVWTGARGACPSYLLDGTITVSASLTIGPGTVIRARENAALRVNGTSAGIVAEGTEERPIVFEGTEATPGWWAGIHVLRTATILDQVGAGVAVFDHVIVRHGGGGAEESALVSGLRVGSSGSGQTASVRIHNSRFEDNAGRGVGLRGITSTGAGQRGAILVGFGNNIFSGNAEAAARMSVTHVASIEAPSVAEDNGRDVIEVFESTTRGGAEWIDPGMPYQVSGTITVRHPVAISEGATFAFARNTALVVSGGNANLVASGTAEEPIIFRGTEDEAGWWQGIWLQRTHDIGEVRAAALAVFEHVVVRDAGQEGQSDAAGIRVGAGGSGDLASVSIRDSRFENNLGHGVHLRQTSSVGAGRRGSILVDFENNTFVDNSGSATVLRVEHIDGVGGGHTATNNGRDVLEVRESTLASDGTWSDAGIPYAVSGGLTIQRALEITERTHVVFDQGTWLEVDGAQGNLNVVGTPEHPVILEGSEPTPGHWYGLRIFRSPDIGSDRAADPAILTHTIIRHAGGDGSDIAAAIRLGAGGSGQLASIILDHVTLEDNLGYGLYARPTSSIGSGTRGGIVESISNSTFRRNAEGPLLLAAEHFGGLDDSNELGFADGQRVVLAGSAVNRDAVWINPGVPIFVSGDIAVTRALTLSAGLEFAFAWNTGIEVNHANAHLVIAGTAEEPVVMEADEGDDGPWRGISLRNTDNRNSTLSHLVVRNAGHNPWCGNTGYGLYLASCASAGNRPNIRYTVRNSTFEGTTSGLWAHSASNANADICTANTFLDGAACVD